MNENLIGLLIAIFFPALFVSLWLAACFAIAVLGGWRELAGFYRAGGTLTGRRWWFQSAHLGLHAGAARYNSILVITASPETLGLSVCFPFHIGHPSLRIPWSDIQIERGEGWFGYKFVVLHLAKAPDIPIVVSARLANQVLEMAGAAWPEKLVG